MFQMQSEQWQHDRTKVCSRDSPGTPEVLGKAAENSMIKFRHNVNVLSRTRKLTFLSRNNVATIYLQGFPDHASLQDPATFNLNSTAARRYVHSLLKYPQCLLHAFLASACAATLWTLRHCRGSFKTAPRDSLASRYHTQVGWVGITTGEN